MALMGNNLSGESTVLCPGAVVYNLCLTRYVRKNWQCNMLCKLIAPIIRTSSPFYGFDNVVA
jgi:hypothetical protein